MLTFNQNTKRNLRSANEKFQKASIKASKLAKLFQYYHKIIMKEDESIRKNISLCSKNIEFPIKEISLEKLSMPLVLSVKKN